MAKRVDPIFALTSPAAFAVKAATDQIPITVRAARAGVQIGLVS